jgi:tetratricopeptide (TPR) repeat protein
MTLLLPQSFRSGCVAAGLLAVMMLMSCRGPSAAAHVKRADAFVEQKQFREASIEYRAALQIDPNLGEARLKLGDVHVRLNEPAEALREYVRAADLLPNNVETQVKAGNFLLLAGQFQDAKTRATKAVALDASSVQAQILLGNSLAGLRDVDGAMAEYQRALALNPSQDVAYRNMATLQAATGRMEDAEATFRKAVAAAPSSVPARLSLASFLWATNRAPEAEQVLKDALAIDPTNLQAMRALGTFYIGSNRLADAEPYFTAIAKAQNTPASQIALADYYLIAHRPDDAKPLLQQAKNDPDTYADAMLRLAAIDLSLDMRAEAQAKLHELLERQPKNMPARLFSARLLAADGKRDEALTQAKTIATDDPQSPVAADAQMLVGTLQASLDRPEEAIKAFQDVLRRRPRSTDAEIALARLSLMKGDAAQAETYIKDALANAPKNPVAHAELVRIRLAQGQSAAARQELASLQAEFPNAPAVLHLIAAQQLIDRQPAAAHSTYERLLKAQPDDADALAGITQIDLATGHRADALARVDQAAQSPHASASLLLVGARAHLAVNEPDKAEALLKRAIDLEPARLQGYSLLGVLYARQNRLPEAIENFRAIATRNPSSISAGTMLGLLYEARGQRADAEREYRRVLALDPQSPVAANNLAWMYVSTDRNISEAAELAKAALTRLPSEPNVNDTVGWIYYRQGQYALAIQHLETSVAKDPSSAAAYYHLGMAYLGDQDREKARTALARALALKTDFDGKAEATQKLAELGG